MHEREESKVNMIEMGRWTVEDRRTGKPVDHHAALAGLGRLTRPAPARTGVSEGDMLAQLRMPHPQDVLETNASTEIYWSAT